MPIYDRFTAALRNPLTSLIYVWKMSHGPEYVGMGVLLLCWQALRWFVTPFHQLYFVNDPRIAFPFAEHEQVTNFMVGVYSGVIPAVILVVYNLATKASRTKHEATYLAYFITFGLNGLVTHTIKNAVGRPRPDFLSRCLPKLPTDDSVSLLLGVPTPLGFEDCTAPPGYKLEDGWRSFPSGHSSFAFAGLGFLALFLAGQLRVFRPEDGGRDLSRLVVFLLPLLGAGWIAITRCEDYRHDVYDVGIGSLIGITTAYWSYRRHWPGLSERDCHKPYPHPSAGKDGWATLRRAEEGNVEDDIQDFELDDFDRR